MTNAIPIFFVLIVVASALGYILRDNALGYMFLVGVFILVTAGVAYTWIFIPMFGEMWAELAFLATTGAFCLGDWLGGRR